MRRRCDQSARTKHKILSSQHWLTVSYSLIIRFRCHIIIVVALSTGLSHNNKTIINALLLLELKQSERTDGRLAEEVRATNFHDNTWTWSSCVWLERGEGSGGREKRKLTPPSYQDGQSVTKNARGISVGWFRMDEAMVRCSSFFFCFVSPYKSFGMPIIWCTSLEVTSLGKIPSMFRPLFA